MFGQRAERARLGHLALLLSVHLGLVGALLVELLELGERALEHQIVVFAKALDLLGLECADLVVVVLGKDLLELVVEQAETLVASDHRRRHRIVRELRLGLELAQALVFVVVVVAVVAIVTQVVDSIEERVVGRARSLFSRPCLVAFFVLIVILIIVVVVVVVVVVVIFGGFLAVRLDEKVVVERVLLVVEVDVGILVEQAHNVRVPVDLGIVIGRALIEVAHLFLEITREHGRRQLQLRFVADAAVVVVVVGVCVLVLVVLFVVLDEHRADLEQVALFVAAAICLLVLVVDLSQVLQVVVVVFVVDAELLLLLELFASSLFALLLGALAAAAECETVDSLDELAARLRIGGHEDALALHLVQVHRILLTAMHQVELDALALFYELLLTTHDARARVALTLTNNGLQTHANENRISIGTNSIV